MVEDHAAVAVVAVLVQIHVSGLSSCFFYVAVDVAATAASAISSVEVVVAMVEDQVVFS